MSDKSFIPLTIPITICIILSFLLVVSYRTYSQTTECQPDAIVDEEAMSLFREEYTENLTNY